MLVKSMISKSLSVSTKKKRDKIKIINNNRSFKPRKKTETSDYEKYEEALKYINQNKISLNSSKLYLAKKKISKISDENLKIILEKSLGLWSRKPKKKEVPSALIYKNTSLYQTRNIKNLGK